MLNTVYRKFNRGCSNFLYMLNVGAKNITKYDTLNATLPETCIGPTKNQWMQQVWCVCYRVQLSSWSLTHISDVWNMSNGYFWCLPLILSGVDIHQSQCAPAF